MSYYNVYNQPHYVWAIFTPSMTITSFTREPLMRYYKKLKESCEICRYKSGVLDSIIDSKYIGDTIHEDYKMIGKRRFDFATGMRIFSLTSLENIKK